jgi:toxin-antitoxin system PIN domain toxin
VTGFLLDTNLLIALLWTSHTEHDRAVRWFTDHRVHGWATCPITETGFVRIVSNPAFSRDAVLPREARDVLAANTAADDHRFWPDDGPFAEVAALVGERLLGHQQVTDAYLLGLAVRHGGALATLDHHIAALTAAGSPGQTALAIVT